MSGYVPPNEREFTKLELGCIPDCFWLFNRGMAPSEIDKYLNIKQGLTRRLIVVLWARDKRSPDRRSMDRSFYE